MLFMVLKAADLCLNGTRIQGIGSGSATLITIVIEMDFNRDTENMEIILKDNFYVYLFHIVIIFFLYLYPNIGIDIPRFKSFFFT